MNLENYFPILLFILVGIGVGVVPQLLGRVLAPYKPDAEKLSPYECGFEAFEDARMKFDVRYYLVAILFILFDIETVFLMADEEFAHVSSSLIKQIAALGHGRSLERFVPVSVIEPLMEKMRATGSR